MVTEGGNSGDRVPFALMSSIQRRKDLNFDPRLRYIAAQHFRMLIFGRFLPKLWRRFGAAIFFVVSRGVNLQLNACTKPMSRGNKDKCVPQSSVTRSSHSRGRHAA